MFFCSQQLCTEEDSNSSRVSRLRRIKQRQERSSLGEARGAERAPMSQVVNVMTGPDGEHFSSQTWPKQPYAVEVCVFVCVFVSTHSFILICQTSL